VDTHPVRLLVLRAHCRYYELTTPSLLDAVRLAERALELDPSSLRGQRMLSLALTGAMVQGAIPRTPENMQRAVDLCRGVARAIPEDVFTRCVLAWALGNAGQHPAAIDELRYAIQLNPRYATLRSDLAEHYALMGYVNEALSEIEEAIRLSHEDVVSFWRYQTAAIAQFAAGNHAAALENARRVLRDKPGLLRGEVFLAASAAALGMMEEARRAVDHLLRDHPGLTLATVAPGLMPRYVQEHHHQQFLHHLGRAGLPA
jgi:tetratricopeptide (TPR) repeat protein